MSEYRDLQVKFTSAIARLLLYAESIGEKPTLGDAYRDPRAFGEWGVAKGYSHPKSTHKCRLALDINLLDDANHSRLHDFWDLLGGSERISNDLNHYSFEYKGVR